MDIDPTPANPVLVLSGGREYLDVADTINSVASAMARLDVLSPTEHDRRLLGERPRMTDEPQRPSNVLRPAETELLRRALGEWGGPANANNDLARAMGFTDSEAMVPQVSELRRALRDDDPVSSRDWARILVSAEIVFVSDLYGSGTEWRTTTGRDDEETIRVLRTIQRKLGSVLRGHYGGKSLLT